MADTFGMVYSHIFDSSLNDESLHVWKTFVSLLALADVDHMVRLSNRDLARKINVPLEQVKEALDRLSSPDPESKCTEDEGRRIINLGTEVEPQWHIVTRALYSDRVRLLSKKVKRSEVNARYYEKTKGTRRKKASSVPSKPKEASLPEATPLTEDLSVKTCSDLNQSYSGLTKMTTSDHKSLTASQSDTPIYYL